MDELFRMKLYLYLSVNLLSEVVLRSISSAVFIHNWRHNLFVINGQRLS